MEIVKHIYDYKLSRVRSETAKKNRSKYYDESIEEAFHIYRHWFLFTIPKVFRVVESLQHYVCECNKKRQVLIAILFNNWKMTLLQNTYLY